MTLGMFAVIVLTLVYMSEISYMNRGRTDEIAQNLSRRVRHRPALEPERSGDRSHSCAPCPA